MVRPGGDAVEFYVAAALVVVADVAAIVGFEIELVRPCGIAIDFWIAARPSFEVDMVCP